MQFKKGLINSKERYADVVAINEQTGDELIINIGEMTKSGVPVKRERDALDDIILSPTMVKHRGAQVIFVEKGAAKLP